MKRFLTVKCNVLVASGDHTNTLVSGGGFRRPYTNTLISGSGFRRPYKYTGQWRWLQKTIHKYTDQWTWLQETLQIHWSVGWLQETMIQWRWLQETSMAVSVTVSVRFTPIRVHVHTDRLFGCICPKQPMYHMSSGAIPVPWPITSISGW